MRHLHKTETDNLLSDKQDTITALSHLELKSLDLSGNLTIDWDTVTYGLDVVCSRPSGYWEIARFKSTGVGVGAFLAFYTAQSNYWWNVGMRGDNTNFNSQWDEDIKMELDIDGRVKFPQMTSSRAIITNGSGHLESSIITDIEFGYLEDVTSNIQAQFNDIYTKN